MSKYGVFSGPYFPVFGLNTEICTVNLRIQPKYSKIRTTENSVFGHFSHSVSDQLSQEIVNVGEERQYPNGSLLLNNTTLMVHNSYGDIILGIVGTRTAIYFQLH